MLKYALLIALTVVSVQSALADDTNDADPTVIRKGVYQKLGLISGESTTVPNEEAGQPDRQPADVQPQQPRDDENTPLTSQ